MTDLSRLRPSRFRTTGRCLQVSAIIAGMLLSRAPRWLTLRLMRRSREAHLFLGECIAETLERLGPVFLKMGQMISHRPDLLPEEFLSPLRRIQDKVKPERFELSRATLEQSLGRDIEQIFSVFDPKPLAAGSIATVYRARRRDGREVAVKIVRQDVSRILVLDLTIGARLVALGARIPFLRSMPVKECYVEIERLFSAQLDMNFDAANLEAMRSDSFIKRHVRVPSVHADLASRDVLVMDFVENAVNISADHIDILVYKQASLSVLAVLYRMAFETGSVHCDMHPGNILLDSSEQIWLLDGGFFTRLSVRDRISFQDLFLGLSFGESVRCCDSVVRSAIKIPQSLDRIALRDDVDALIEAHHGKNAGTFLVANFVFDLLMLQKRYKLYARTGFIAAIWAFVTFEGIVRDRFPELDFQTEAKPFVVSGIITRMRNP